MVSIITPTHKKMTFWEITVLSVLCQSDENWEWIVLDNSSIPYFRIEFENLLLKYPEYLHLKEKVKIYECIFPEVNIGKYKNFCVSKTTCKDDEFVLLLDHDDILMKDCVKDIEITRKKIGNEIDYITSDCPIVTYFDNMIRAEQLYEKWIEPIECKDFSIRNYTFNLNNIKSAKRLDEIDVKNHQMYIAEHPRIIKKSILTTETCKFHEKCTYSEDTIQRIMLTLFHKGVYIPKQEIFCIHIRPDNTDVTYIDSGTWKQFNEKYDEITELYKHIDILYKEYNWLFPNVDVIKIPHFDPDKE